MSIWIRAFLREPLVATPDELVPILDDENAF